jgi:uncharacterized protein (TIGR02598 family)
MKSSLETPSSRVCAAHGAPAFSLVEVTIAVAIAAMGFITLLGLLPQGITMARDAAEMSVGSKIIQKLSGEMQSMSWDRITWTGYSPLRYFTSEGMEITASDGASAEDIAASLAYVASVYVPETPLDVVLPTGTGGGSSAQPENFVRRVKICVATSSDPAFEFASASPLRVTSTYALVAKMGQ